ncbi:hypothetical protein FVEG_02662 [Fusarium verticillioides 7600]|uniref:Zn(2)-C6 fungal-type domain-containing protein n=2 Tax=Fusarium fujikuroi species complex TaxID=171627 RepID=W7LXN4_GIBM7|nr:hypothetical protein FVEG_02662 [Fusarium verticillioides 7600]XP_018746341.1 hypothetical protein FVEG_02662 [Fusarium verticillioides 7600]XP_018746342.1 hypothetical protein FVEG_02662 [Fusarium verticillioides 7600]RBR04328.1 hypothetical protein FVER53590_02662 [Fusarium verticillioides]EWG40149.1 hypothetical protein FVEG_02662 [Fusarium verticillioides 7600]EWG40150.1 hypothetical protein FVEG_02662 [Fusarium verticillioides 7600]EWG40151.1 hypothetical protein FVEG_02662 [Fusarium 
MSRSVSSSRGSESPMEPERAHRACEKCTRTKKKCDKALPACSRCTRLATTCSYDFIYTAPTTAVVEPGYLAGSTPKEAYGQGIFDPAFDVSSSMVMALLSSRNIPWREATERYFETMNPWFSVIHPELFAIRTDNLGSGASSNADQGPRDPAVALLIVCMQLVSQYDDEAAAASTNVNEGKDMIEMPAYRAAKRALSVLRGLSAPSIELVQCSILLALFEFGHGDVMRAYVSIGDANTMAMVLRIGPGKYIEAEREANIPYEEEERRCVYWSLFVLDRLIHVDCSLIHMPLQVPSPAADDLLPTSNLIWHNQNQSPTRSVQRHPASVAPSVPLGPFQRNCQCAMLYTRAYSPKPQGNPNALLEEYVELDIATRALVEAMIMQTSRWGDFYECFATCTCLLLFLYCRQLRAANTISAAGPFSPTADDIAPKAIAGLNFTIRIIADTTTDLNDQLAHRPHLLAPCSPVTPYSAYHCLMVLSHLEHLIPEADTRFHNIFASLHFFAKRWGVAGQLVNKVEMFLADADETQWCFMDE